MVRAVKNKKNKRGIEASFAWIFAIIAGAAIIVLAVYGVTKLVGTERHGIDTETAKQIEILLSPIETNLEAGITNKIKFSAETRVYNNCRERGTFGEQGIAAATKSGIGKAWQKPGAESIVYNKYLFSGKIIEGNEMLMFAKNFEMPYKIASIILAWSDRDEYCFVNPTREIEDELTDLKPKGINVTSAIEECKKNAKVVCFDSQDAKCDIKVFPQLNKVEKEYRGLYYEDNLIYGAIFADAVTYECQVKRLMKRASELGFLYADKTENIEAKGCGAWLAVDLRAYADAAAKIKNSAELGGLKQMADELERRNELLLDRCAVF